MDGGLGKLGMMKIVRVSHGNGVFPKTLVFYQAGFASDLKLNTFPWNELTINIRGTGCATKNRSPRTGIVYLLITELTNHVTTL